MGTILKNVMEDAVMLKLDEVMDASEVCRCAQCRLDVASFSLNQLSPKYAATEKGELYSKAFNLVKQHELDIVSALGRACIVVKNNPRH